LVVYNEFIADFFRPLSDKVEVYPSGVDTKMFTPANTPREHSKPVIFVPGRVNDELKGFGTVKKACEHLRGKGLDFEVRITAAYDMHFEENWITNLGWVSQEALPALYHSSDIVVVPSLWVEPFGITTLEAMACGLPVIGSRIGGIAETLVDGRTGIHFTAGNEEELAEALERLIQSPDLRREYGQAGRRRAEEVYDWDVLVDKYYAEPFSRLAKPGS
jgi:glycosyltransferase involved in cell wall biosynthesis